MARTTQKTAPKTTRTRKVVTPKQKAVKAAAPKAAPTNSHIDAGINVARYTGPSKFVNSNRKPKIMLGREVKTLTDRAASGLYALRECYGEKSFAPRGFDNGILRDLVGKGLVKVSGGQKTVIDGTDYMVDGAKPVQLVITAAGQEYGRA